VAPVTVPSCRNLPAAITVESKAEAAPVAVVQERKMPFWLFCTPGSQEEPPAAHKVDTPIQGHLLANARLSVASERGRI